MLCWAAFPVLRFTHKGQSIPTGAAACLPACWLLPCRVDCVYWAEKQCMRFEARFQPQTPQTSNPSNLKHNLLYRFEPISLRSFFYKRFKLKK